MRLAHCLLGVIAGTLINILCKVGSDSAGGIDIIIMLLSGISVMILLQPYEKPNT